MLQSIRDKTSGWIAYLIVFLISVPFALWGVNSYLGGGKVAPAAVVNGHEISLRDLDTSYTNYRRRLAQAFGGTIPEAFSDESLMKDQVLSQMIEEYSLRSYADKKNLKVGDKQLNQAIRSMDVFQTDGKFDPAVYQRQVASLGYSTAGFEFELRQTQAIEQLQTAISATAFTIPKTRKILSTLANQSRKIRLLTRKLDSKNLSISDKEIEDYYEKNTARYLTDEQVKIDYVELSLEGVKATIEVSEDQIRSRYDQAGDAHTSAEIRTASHILLTLAADASEDESNQVENRLKDLRVRLESGEDFANLAKEYSQDSVSAENGGDLGEIERGTMVKPFETALFGLKVGEISQPIKTSFGWHLIKLNAISGGKVETFDDLHDEIADELKTELAENQIYDLTENLSNLAYEQPDSLLPAVEKLGLVMQTSGWFGRFKGDGIASESKVRKAAFSTEVLSQGINSGAIELADNRIVFIHINDHKPAEAKNLEEVRDQISSELKRNKARKENTAAGKKALEELKSGQSLEQIALQWNSKVVEAVSIKRDSTEVDGDIVRLAFTMKKPQSGSIYEGFERSNGDYSLLELVAVEIDGTDVPDEQIKSLTTAVASQEYQSVLKLLASRADVVKTPASELAN